MRRHPRIVKTGNPHGEYRAIIIFVKSGIYSDLAGAGSSHTPGRWRLAFNLHPGQFDAALSGHDAASIMNIFRSHVIHRRLHVHRDALTSLADERTMHSPAECVEIDAFG